MIGFLFILPAVIAGIVFLQIYLSKQESRWPGLVLPLITFLFSLMMVMSMAAFHSFSSTSVIQTVETENGAVVVREELIHHETNREVIPGAIFGVMLMFIYTNIPTAVLLAIYKATRSKQNRIKDLEKMNLQDLE